MDLNVICISCLWFQVCQAAVNSDVKELKTQVATLEDRIKIIETQMKYEVVKKQE